MLNPFRSVALAAMLALSSLAAVGQESHGAATRLRPCTGVQVDPPALVTLGKSTVISLDFPVVRMVVGGQSTSRAGQPADAADKEKSAAATPPRNEHGVAEVDITLLNSTELFILGKQPGSMNIVLQGTQGRCAIKDIIVTLDPTTLQATLRELMPEEAGVRIRAAEGALVLTGDVSDAGRLDEIVRIARSYGDGKKVVNMLRVAAPQQVMLEVKIAEVSKTLLDKFGLDFSRLVTSDGGLTSRIVSGIVGGGAAAIGHYGGNLAPGYVTGRAVAGVAGSSAAAAGALGHPEFGFPTSNGTLLGIDAEKRDGLVRVLAEPNIMAISGQKASFLSGGKIFIPVAQDTVAGGTRITLEEKEFGVGLQFTPTVLGGRINLKLVSEVSELSQTGSPFTAINGVTAILPSMTTRRADTTVQLGDGQSFVIAGLIRNNVTETINRFPGVGEVPILGALFRSTEFQNDQTELVFVVTPRLVKPLTGPVTLPTDNHVVPSRADVLFRGMAEGAAPSPDTSGAPEPAVQPETK